MPRLVFLTIVGLLQISTIFAQAVKSDEVASLNRKIVSLYQQGKFDEAIPIADKVISIEKKASENSEGYANALMNLAQLHKEKAKFLKGNLSLIEERKRYAAYLTSRESGASAKKYFRAALNVLKDLKLEESAAAAMLKCELAWATYNFTVSDSLAEGRSQVDDAERLYTEALAIADKLSPANAALQTSILNNFGDFYMHYVNFEKAFVLYERSVRIAQAKYGAKGKQLLGGLSGLNEIYMITDRESDSNSTLVRIADVTGKTDKPVIKYRYLDARSRGFGKVKAGDFIHRDYTDLDRSYSMTAEMQRMVTPPGQYTLKMIEIEIVVGEDGNVIQAKVLTPTKYNTEVEEAALASKFRPFECDGKRQKIKGKMYFHFRQY